VKVLAYGGFRSKPRRLGLPHRKPDRDLHQLGCRCHVWSDFTCNLHLWRNRAGPRTPSPAKKRPAQNSASVGVARAAQRLRASAPGKGCEMCAGPIVTWRSFTHCGKNSAGLSPGVAQLP